MKQKKGVEGLQTFGGPLCTGWLNDPEMILERLASMQAVCCRVVRHRSNSFSLAEHSYSRTLKRTALPAVSLK